MHNRTEIKARLDKILENQLLTKPELLVESSSFFDDLGADSLDMVEILMAIEEEFKGELEGAIPDSHAEQMQTYGDVLEYLVSGGKKLPQNP